MTNTPNVGQPSNSDEGHSGNGWGHGEQSVGHGGQPCVCRGAGWC